MQFVHKLYSSQYYFPTNFSGFQMDISCKASKFCRHSLYPNRSYMANNFKTLRFHPPSNTKLHNSLHSLMQPCLSIRGRCVPRILFVYRITFDISTTMLVSQPSWLALSYYTQTIYDFIHLLFTLQTESLLLKTLIDIVNNC